MLAGFFTHSHHRIIFTLLFFRLLSKMVLIFFSWWMRLDTMVEKSLYSLRICDFCCCFFRKINSLNFHLCIFSLDQKFSASKRWWKCFSPTSLDKQNRNFLCKWNRRKLENSLENRIWKSILTETSLPLNIKQMMKPQIFYKAHFE